MNKRDMLFEPDPAGPVARLRWRLDGSSRRADGRSLLTLRQAARRFHTAEVELVDQWRETFGLVLQLARVLAKRKGV